MDYDNYDKKNRDILIAMGNPPSARMGIAPNAAGKKDMLREMPRPSEDVEDIMWELSWIGQLLPPNHPLSFLGEIFGWIWLYLL